MGKDNVVIAVNDLAFGYGADRPVLAGLDFTLSAGEAVGISGRNGSGKTTLLHLLVGLLKPSGGSIQLFGQNCREERDFRGLRGRVGLLFQDADDQLFCPTVEEDVAFGPLNQGKSHDAAREIARQCLCDVGLSGFEPRITHHLSGGEKKLVALAGVLAMQPEVLLLDEPTSNLDEHTHERVTVILAALPQAKIVVSHDRPLLSRVVQRCYRLTQGRLAEA